MLKRGAGVVARSSSRLQGSLEARASSAFDGDPSTAWTPRFSGEPRPWLEAQLPAPVTFDRLDLTVVADKRHSLPARLRVETESGVVQVAVPSIANRAREGATVTVPLKLRRTLSGQTVRIVVERVNERRGRDYVSGGNEVLPVGIAEAGVPGVRVAPTPATVDLGCRDDMVTVDGRRIAVHVSGDSRTAEARGALAVDLCGADAGGIDLGTGEHVLRTVGGQRTGIDLDRLTLSSAPGGRSVAAPAPGRAAPLDPPASPSPSVTVEHDGRTRQRVRVSAPHEPFWLVLGQSHSLGWRATVNGRSLGPPVIVDGFANGWLVQPDAAGRDIDVELTWTPQRRVWTMLGISLIGILLCVALALRNPGRARARDPMPQPRLTSFWRHGGHRPGRTAAVAVTAGLFLGVTLVAGPLTGALVGAAALAALHRPRARALLTIGAVAAVAATGLYTAGLQLVHPYPAVSEWPGFFRISHNLAWVAIALLAADVVVGVAREGAASRPR